MNRGCWCELLPNCDDVSAVIIYVQLIDFSCSPEFDRESFIRIKPVIRHRDHDEFFLSIDLQAELITFKPNGVPAICRRAVIAADEGLNRGVGKSHSHNGSFGLLWVWHVIGGRCGR